MLHTIDMRGAFLNAEFTAADKPIYLRINMDVAPYWILQDPQAAPYVSQHGELVLLLDRFLYRLKQLPLKFQLHLTKTGLVDHHGVMYIARLSRPDLLLSTAYLAGLRITISAVILDGS